MDTIRLCFAGFGNVGRRFSKLLLEKQEYIEDEFGIKVIITGIVTVSKGTLINIDGIDIKKAIDMVEIDKCFHSAYSDYCKLDVFDALKKSHADVLIEVTSLSINDGEPATSFIKYSLKNKIHVITANKGPEAIHFKELSKLAKDNNTKFLYETIVMDGTPIFNMVSKTLHGNNIYGLRGILNGTSNYVFSRLDEGASYEEAIFEAQSNGLAEADPSNDMDGWDGAAKICAMVNIIMGKEITPDKVFIKSAADVTKEDIKNAKVANKKIKYVCTARNDEAGNFAVSVKPELISTNDPLYNVDYTSAAVTFYTDLAGEITIVQKDPKILQTSYGLLSDLITLIKETKNS